MDQPGASAQQSGPHAGHDPLAQESSGHESAGHGHHAADVTGAFDHSPEANQSGSEKLTAPCSCCDACVAACLGSSLLVLNLHLATLEPAVPDGHFSNAHASQFLPGPIYPSLYRPPISHI